MASFSSLLLSNGALLLALFFYTVLLVLSQSPVSLRVVHIKDNSSRHNIHPVPMFSARAGDRLPLK